MEKQKNNIKTRKGSGYLKQLYATARSTAGKTHSHLKNLTTLLVNFIPTEKVDASELQVRTHFDSEELQALSQSIRKHGVLQPILVVQDGERYKVIAGERRLRASKLAGIERIPARVISSSNQEVHEIALRENLDRVDLHPVEEGEGYVSLLESQAYKSHEAIAKAFGKPKSRVTECIGFTRLPQQTKRSLLEHQLKSRALLRGLLQTPIEEHKAILERAIQKKDSDSVSIENKKPSHLKKKVPLSFQALCSTKKIRMQRFQWKLGEDKTILRKFIHELESFIKKVKNTHLQI